MCIKNGLVRIFLTIYEDSLSQEEVLESEFSTQMQSKVIIEAKGNINEENKKRSEFDEKEAKILIKRENKMHEVEFKEKLQNFIKMKFTHHQKSQLSSDKNYSQELIINCPPDTCLQIDLSNGNFYLKTNLGFELHDFLSKIFSQVT